jgi:hypothetical protein
VDVDVASAVVSKLNALGAAMREKERGTRPQIQVVERQATALIEAFPSLARRASEMQQQWLERRHWALARLAASRETPEESAARSARNALRDMRRFVCSEREVQACHRLPCLWRWLASS